MAIAALNAVFALVIICAALGLVLIGARRFGLTPGAPGGIGLVKKRNRRLELVEQIPLDARRRLAIVRIDTVERALIIGGERDLDLGVVNAGQAVSETAFDLDRDDDPAANDFAFADDRIISAFGGVR